MRGPLRRDEVRVGTKAFRFLKDLQAWLKPRRVSLVAVKAAGEIGVTRVVLGVGLAWAASRTCEERLERLPVPPDAMPGMTNLRRVLEAAALEEAAGLDWRVLESGLTTLATALGGVRRWRQA